MSSYTTARVGGKARYLLVIRTSEELAEAVSILWELETPFLVLGSGANVLFSDRGYNGVILLNRAHTIKVDAGSIPPTIWAESGTNLGTVARRAAQRGLSGLEWAAGIPGTIGGAVDGNAGAPGKDMSTNLVVAEILHPNGHEHWPVERLEYAYRTSILKRQPGQHVVLSATLALQPSTPEAVQARSNEFTERRHQTQPGIGREGCRGQMANDVSGSQDPLKATADDDDRRRPGLAHRPRRLGERDVRSDSHDIHTTAVENIHQSHSAAVTIVIGHCRSPVTIPGTVFPVAISFRPAPGSQGNPAAADRFPCLRG